MPKTEMVFPEGMIGQEPHPNAPDFIKAQVSIKREDFMAWLNDREEEWLRFDIKESRGGKWYCSLNTFEPKSGGGDETIPF